MNDEAARQDRPAHSVDLALETVAQEHDGSAPATPFRLAIVVALEALEAGDVDLAVAVLLGALEDGPAVREYPCPFCGVRFEWPGLLEHHLRLAHSEDSGRIELGQAA